MNRRDFVRVCTLASVALVTGTSVAKDGKKDVWVFTFKKKGSSKEHTTEITARNLEKAREKFRDKHPGVTILSVDRKP
jgi:hypothetical protein